MKDKDLAALTKMQRIIDREFPKTLKMKARAFREKQKLVKGFTLLSEQLLNEKKNQELLRKSPPIHPWRMCPLGHSWVRTHPRKVAASSKNPNGYTMVDGHCRTNPRGKDLMGAEEIEKISLERFRDLLPMPCSSDLGFRRKSADGKAFDHLIAGWTKYWNEVFSPKEPLDPNLVKALIASESGFRPNVKIDVPGRKNIKARGLMQITDETLSIVSKQRGEVKDHFIELSMSEVMNPSANIYTGIRWLFHKKKLASNKLKRDASWWEAVADYKSYLKAVVAKPNVTPRGMLVFQDYFERLKKCGK